MTKFDLNFLYIAIAVIMLIFTLSNLYRGTYVIILAQLLFISVFSEGSMSGDTSALGVSKVIYGILFAMWFGAWGLSRGFIRGKKHASLSNSMTAPTLALGAFLGLAILLGLVYDADLSDVLRDLSQYAGYLAVLPLLDLVRTSRQARKLILYMALLGLPTFLLTTIWAIDVKQQLHIVPELFMFQFADQYFGPIEGAIWAVAVSFPGLAGKLLTWLWLLLEGGMCIYSGYRYRLLMFILAALTAFVFSGRLARHSLIRYFIPLILSLILVALVADLSGIINLPLTDITRDRYSTLLSRETLYQDDSVQGRFREGQWLLENFWKNPVTGIGLGHGMEDPHIPGGYNFLYHDGYYASLMKFGVIGSLIFVWYFLTLLRQAVALGQTGETYFARVIGVGMVIWLVPAMVASYWVNFFANRGFALTVGVMAGLLPALAQPLGRWPKPNKAPVKIARPALKWK